MKKGVSLISLIITIVVIIILASITIFSSLDTVEQSQQLKKETEFEEVTTFVRSISTKAEGGLITLNLTNDTVATVSQLSSFYSEGDETELSSEEIQRIEAINASSQNNKYKYHYIRGSQIENGIIPGLENINSSNYGVNFPKKVENDYLINFYYGVVVAKVSQVKTLVRGNVLKQSVVIGYNSSSGSDPNVDPNSDSTSVLSGFKIGDYVDYKPVPKNDGKYTPDSEKTGSSSNREIKTNTSAEWRILYADDDNKVLYVTPGIITTNAISLYGLKGYYYGAEEIKKACNILYSNTEKNIEATNLTVDIVNKACGITDTGRQSYVFYNSEEEQGYLSNETGETIDGVTYIRGVASDWNKFFTGNGATIWGGTKGYQAEYNKNWEYRMPTSGNPVYVKDTSLYYNYPDTTERPIGSILSHGIDDGYLASPCVCCISDYSNFGIQTIGPRTSSVSYKSLLNSNADYYSSGNMLVPLVVISYGQIKDKTTVESTVTWLLK